MSDVLKAFPYGTIVWAKPQGWPWWPAMVVPYNFLLLIPDGSIVPHEDDTKVCVEFFIDGRISVVPASDVMLFDKGMYHAQIFGRFANKIKQAVKAVRMLMEYQRCSPKERSGEHNKETEIYNEVADVNHELAKEVALLKKREIVLIALKKELADMSI